MQSFTPFRTIVERISPPRYTVVNGWPGSCCGCDGTVARMLLNEMVRRIGRRFPIESLSLIGEVEGSVADWVAPRLRWLGPTPMEIGPVTSCITRLENDIFSKTDPFPQRILIGQP